MPNLAVFQVPEKSTDSEYGGRSGGLRGAQLGSQCPWQKLLVFGRLPLAVIGGDETDHCDQHGSGV
jgi:hypothetical protein